MRKLGAKVARSRSATQKVEFQIDVVDSHGITNTPGALLRLQLSRKSASLSSQTAHAPAPLGGWEPGLGVIHLTSKLHVVGSKYLEKTYQVALLRTMPPVTSGKRWYASVPRCEPAGTGSLQSAPLDLPPSLIPAPCAPPLHVCGRLLICSALHKRSAGRPSAWPPSIWRPLLTSTAWAPIAARTPSCSPPR